MRALPLAIAKASRPAGSAKVKLKLPPPKTSFRAHLPQVNAPSLPSAHEAPRAPEPKTTVAPKRDSKAEPEAIELDSAARTAALLAPPAHLPPVPAAPPKTATTAPSLQPHVAAELLEKAAFWGDGTRGLARLRFNGRARAGLANATITLETDGDEMHLRVEGVDDGDLERLRERLAERGVKISGES